MSLDLIISSMPEEFLFAQWLLRLQKCLDAIKVDPTFPLRKVLKMKSVLSLCKLGQQHQQMERICVRSSGAKQVPTKLEIAALRVLSTVVAKKSYYEVLGISRSASTEEIRHAFLKLSKQCHPDANKSDPENHMKFVQVNEAYTVLSKPLSRKDYDMALDAQRYVSQHMNANAYKTHPYRKQPEEQPYYHHRAHFYESDWARNEHHKEHGKNENIPGILHFYAITFCVTFATICQIIHFMDTAVPNSQLELLQRKITEEDLEKHDHIMTSHNDGIIVEYYAVPKENDPKSFEVLAVKRSSVKNSDAHELHILNNIQYQKRATLKS